MNRNDRPILPSAEALCLVDKLIRSGAILTANRLAVAEKIDESAEAQGKAVGALFQEGRLHLESSPEARAEWAKAHGLSVEWCLMQYSEIQILREELVALKKERDEYKKALDGIMATAMQRVVDQMTPDSAPSVAAMKCAKDVLHVIFDDVAKAFEDHYDPDESKEIVEIVARIIDEALATSLAVARTLDAAPHPALMKEADELRAACNILTPEQRYEAEKQGQALIDAAMQRK